MSPSKRSPSSSRDHSMSSKSGSESDNSSSSSRKNKKLNVTSKPSKYPDIKMMRRPSYGQKGKPFMLETNFFPLRISGNLIVSQYSVGIYFSNDVKNEKKRKTPASSSDDHSQREWIDVSHTSPIQFNRNVFRLFYETHSRALGCPLAYDGRSIAYAPQEVNRSFLGTYYDFVVDRDGKKINPSNPNSFRRECRVKIEHAKYLPFKHLLSDGNHNVESAEFMAALDVVLAQPARKQGYIQVGRSFYGSRNARPLGRNNVICSAWHGFYQSARFCNLRLAVNMDESYTAFWDKGARPLMELVAAANSDSPVTYQTNPAILRRIALTLKNVKVRAKHNGIPYKVYNFVPHNPYTYEFYSRDEKRNITVADYFYQQYNIRLNDRRSPLVKVHRTQDVLIPMEVLVVSENQRMTGLLRPDQISDIVKVASGYPSNRRANAIQTIKNVNHNNDHTCRKFKLQVDSKPLQVRARLLPAPQIAYYRNKKVTPRNGQWETQDLCLKGTELGPWAIAVDGRFRAFDDVSNFKWKFVKAAEKHGMTVRVREPEVFTSANTNDLSQTVARAARSIEDKIAKKTHGYSNDSPRFVLVILDRADTVAYNRIKRFGDLQGIFTQVVLGNTVKRKSNPTTMENIIFKVNSKLGGQNSKVLLYDGVAIPNIHFANYPHIVLGADVTHPMGGSNRASVAALVGSRDRDGVQYSASIRNQAPRQEIISELGEMFSEVYRAWRHNFGNQVHARTIIMFRDGVSEGQFEEVMQKEVTSLRHACRKITPKPKITYIIVTKRHHTRFFPMSKNESSRSGNILPGTVVDQGITSSEYFDFYLNTHEGIKGTNRPSKYTVLLDENAIDADALQAYIYRLSHGFMRCNRSVSMVNSAYYAHLLAARGRAYLYDEDNETASTVSNESIPPSPRIHESLQRNLYFL